MNQLTGQTALVTGGGTGIGFAIAKSLVSSGTNVCITGRRESVLQDAVAELGDKATYFVGDVTEAQHRQAMIEHAQTTFGRYISILVNNAGQNVKKPAVEVTDQDFDDVMSTHVNAAFALARDVAPQMLQHQHGNIIFLASMASFMGVPNVIAYTTAKSAVLGLTRGLAAEWSEQGIRVNAIAPGWISTPMTDAAFNNDPVRKNKVLSRTPMAKMGEPEDIANMAKFLCSAESKFITGQCYTVDGGAAIGF